MGKGSGRRNAAVPENAVAASWTRTLGEGTREAGKFAKCRLCGTVHRVYVPPKPEYSKGTVVFPLVHESEFTQYCPKP